MQPTDITPKAAVEFRDRLIALSRAFNQVLTSSDELAPLRIAAMVCEVKSLQGFVDAFLPEED